MQNLLRLDRLLIPLLAFLIGVWTNLISEKLATVFLYLIPVVAIVVYLVRSWIARRSPPDWITNLDPPILLNDGPEQSRNARKGLIVFVSTYNPLAKSSLGSLPNEMKFAAIKKAIESEDLVALDFPHSNIDMAIRATRAHKDRLEHCWLIATKSKMEGTKEMVGSDVILKPLRKYLETVEGIRCQFHDENEYQIDQTDDALLYSQVYAVVRKIFEVARKEHGLPSNEVIVDCTGGVKSMTLGAILASLGKTHDVQLTAARYEDGKPVDKSQVTIVYRFSPDPPPAESV